MVVLGLVCDGGIPTRVGIFNRSRIEILCGRILWIGVDVVGDEFGIWMERKRE